jgi:hypothetical protein
MAAFAMRVSMIAAIHTASTATKSCFRAFHDFPYREAQFLWHCLRCPQRCLVPTRQGMQLHPQYPEDEHILFLLLISHHNPFVLRAGIEPTTRGLRVRSTAELPERQAFGAGPAFA